jgi:hypothetical protein
MLSPSIMMNRISEAERYLELALEGYSKKWELYRYDAEARADLPLALALIHPDNWSDRAGRKEIQGPRSFRTATIHVTRACDAPDYWGVNCISDTAVEGAAADHAWPYSLGGPTAVGNIAWLCRRHNQIKGADIHFYPWESGWPDWLPWHLDRVQSILA